jgi:hypothetical protein
VKTFLHVTFITGVALGAFAAVACDGDNGEPTVQAFIRTAEQADKDHEANAEPIRARLDVIASSLTPDQPVPDEAKDLFRQLFEGESDFADAIARLNAPDGYEDLQSDAIEALRAESDFGIAMLDALPKDAAVADLMAQFESDEAAAFQVRRTQACVSMQRLADDRGIAADFTC